MRGQNQYDNPKPKVFSSYDTSFTSSDSPVTLDIRTVLNRNSVDGYIKNGGSNRLTFQTSADGITFNAPINLDSGLTYSIRSMDIDSIKITWVADTKYDVVAL